MVLPIFLRRRRQRRERVPTPPNDATKFLDGTAGLLRMSRTPICHFVGYYYQRRFHLRSTVSRPSFRGNSTRYLDGNGNYTVPAGGTGGSCIRMRPSHLTPASIILPPTMTWAYQVNATNSTNTNGVLMLATWGSSTSNFEIYGKSIAAGNFDLIVCGAALPGVVNNLVAFCVALWDSGSGKGVYLQINVGTSGGSTIFVNHYPSFTGSPTSVINQQCNIGAGVPIWLRPSSQLLNRPHIARMKL